MNPSAFSVVRTARTAAEADVLIAALRGAGLHPLDLDTSPHFSLAGTDVEFQIKLPSDEVNAARELLSFRDDSSQTA
jgi:hypothetical protein